MPHERVLVALLDTVLVMLGPCWWSDGALALSVALICDRRTSVHTPLNMRTYISAHIGALHAALEAQDLREIDRVHRTAIG